MTAIKPVDTVGGHLTTWDGDFFREYLITSLAFLRKEGLVITVSAHASSLVKVAAVGLSLLYTTYGAAHYHDL